MELQIYPLFNSLSRTEWLEVQPACQPAGSAMQLKPDRITIAGDQKK
jgi:hypothetical protein